MYLQASFSSRKGTCCGENNNLSLIRIVISPFFPDITKLVVIILDTAQGCEGTIEYLIMVLAHLLSLVDRQRIKDHGRGREIRPRMPYGVSHILLLMKPIFPVR